MKIFKIPDGGRQLFKKLLFGNNSAADFPISVKFCVHEEAVFHRISVTGQIPAFHRTYLCCPNVT